MNSVHFSSETDQWETPQWLFDLLDAEFSFELDTCATAGNKKCPCYYSPEMDGLKQLWKGTCWMNPPYGREIGRWIEKAYESSLAGATVVCLIPSRTDTLWWHGLITKAHEIRFLKGRLKFGRSENSAPFPSAIVVFRPGKCKEPRVHFVSLTEVQSSLFAC
jgi:phage N-6-adenine-methyltransferase